MAKYEANLQGGFSELLTLIDDGILHGSFSATYEDGSDYELGKTRIAVRVYERFSMIGSNRVSLTVTLIESNENLFISAITTGGSQAVFLKINTWGEENFLDSLISIVEKYEIGD